MCNICIHENKLNRNLTWTYVISNVYKDSSHCRKKKSINNSQLADSRLHVRYIAFSIILLLIIGYLLIEEVPDYATREPYKI